MKAFRESARLLSSFMAICMGTFVASLARQSMCRGLQCHCRVCNVSSVYTVCIADAALIEGGGKANVPGLNGGHCHSTARPAVSLATQSLGYNDGKRLGSLGSMRHVHARLSGFSLYQKQLAMQIHANHWMVISEAYAEDVRLNYLLCVSLLDSLHLFCSSSVHDKERDAHYKVQQLRDRAFLKSSLSSE